MSALKACELVYILESVGDGKKRLSRISEVFFDESRNSVFANDLMRWSGEAGGWTYNAELTEGLAAKMRRKNPDAEAVLRNELRKLAAGMPMSSPIRESLKSKIVLNE
ncbi:hypothetical protein D3C71_1702060 [compost metagenome]